MSGASARELLLQTGNGYYYGTEKDGRWWKRYMRGGWFSRGNCEIWVDREGIHFRRYLTKRVMHLPFDVVTGIEVGSGHAGKWFGAPAIKVAWRKDDLQLMSGFTVSWKKEETERWVAIFLNLLKQRRSDRGAPLSP